MDRRVFLKNSALLSAIGASGASYALGADAQSAEPIKSQPLNYLPPTPENYAKLADETEAVLRKDVLGVWFPLTVDNDNGGFRSNFARDWKPVAKGDGKFSVFQGRMTWISSQVVMRRPDLKMQFEPVVKHGVAYLRDV